MQHGATGLSAFLILLVLSACTSTDDRFEDTTQSKRDFYLSGVEIDREAQKAGAPLIFTGPAPHGAERVAAGSLLFSDSGYVLVRVGVGEPAVGLDGRRTLHGYDVLDFRGRVDPSGERAVSTPTPGGRQRGDRADEVRLEVESDDHVFVQAYRDGRPQAYRYRFSRRGLPRTGVVFPWK